MGRLADTGRLIAETGRLIARRPDTALAAMFCFLPYSRRYILAVIDEEEAECELRAVIPADEIDAAMDLVEARTKMIREAREGWPYVHAGTCRRAALRLTLVEYALHGELRPLFNSRNFIQALQGTL